MKIIKYISVILVSLFCITACNSQDDDSIGIGERTSYVYTSMAVNLYDPEYTIDAKNAIHSGDDYYVFALKFKRDLTDYYNTVFCIDEDGTVLSEYTLSDDCNLYVNGIVDDNKIIYSTGSNAIEIYDMESGNVTSPVRCSSNISGIQKASDGYVILASGEAYKYDEDWILKSTVANSDWQYYSGTNCYYEDNGREYVIAGRGFQDKYYEISFETQTSSLIYDPRTDGKYSISCSGPYVFDEDGLCKYDFVNATIVPLTSWNYMNLQPAQYQASIPIYSMTDDNEFLQVYSYDNGIAQLIVYTYDPTLNYSSRTQLTIGGYACSNDASLNWAIYKYNTSQDEYYVVIDEYSKQFDWDSYEDAVTARLALTEYLRDGNAPDMYYGIYFDYDVFAETGDIINIYPYLKDRVNEEGFSQISDSILNLIVDNETCYRVFSSYQMDGFKGLIDEVGNDSDMSIGDVEELASLSDKMLFDNTRSIDLASDAIANSIPDDGFNTDELMTIVDYSINYGNANYVSASGYNLDALLHNSNINSPIVWSEDEQIYGGALINIGYPSVDGSSHSIMPFGELAVSSTSEYPDACCDFISILWSNEVQDMCSTQCLIPVNDECLRNSAYYAVNHDLIPEEDYAIKGYWSLFDEISIDSAERYIENVYAADSITNADLGLLGIIEEEIDSYYSQNKPIEDVVRVLDSRLSLYLEE